MQAYLLGTGLRPSARQKRGVDVPRLALTDRFVAGAKSAQAPQTDYFDARTPGLAPRVTKGGHKAWTYIFTAHDTGKRG
jgi:hypothetical protein